MDKAAALVPSLNWLSVMSNCTDLPLNTNTPIHLTTVILEVALTIPSSQLLKLKLMAISNSQLTTTTHSYTLLSPLVLLLCQLMLHNGTTMKAVSSTDAAIPKIWTSITLLPLRDMALMSSSVTIG